MGVLTDFFLATDEELKSVCPGWKKPAPLLDEFRTMTVINPFTKQGIEIRKSMNPDQPNADPNAALHCEFRHLPRIDQKGIMDTEIVQLACLLMDWDYETADAEIHGRILNGPTADCEETVLEIHPQMTNRLASLAADDCSRLGTAWPESHRKEAESIQDEFTRNHKIARPNSEWISRLTELSSLAKRAVSDSRNMFMWMST